MRDSYKKLVEVLKNGEQARVTMRQQSTMVEREQAREAYQQYVGDEVVPAIQAALEDAGGDLEAHQLMQLGEKLEAMLDSKNLLEAIDLIPPDHERCQVESRSFMTLGPGMHRCTNKPTVIVYEKVVEKGPLGSMSMCDGCLEVFKKKNGELGMRKYEIEKIKRKTVPHPSDEELQRLKKFGVTRGGRKLTISGAKNLYDEAASESIPELRRLGKLYFNAEWLSGANKKTILKGYRKQIENFMKELGEKP